MISMDTPHAVRQEAGHNPGNQNLYKSELSSPGVVDSLMQNYTAGEPPYKMLMENGQPHITSEEALDLLRIISNTELSWAGKADSDISTLNRPISADEAPQILDTIQAAAVQRADSKAQVTMIKSLRNVIQAYRQSN